MDSTIDRSAVDWEELKRELIRNFCFHPGLLARFLYIDPIAFRLRKSK
jgi:hypothetical protein